MMPAAAATGSDRPGPGSSLLAGAARFADRLPMLRKALDQAALACSEDLTAITAAPVDVSLIEIAGGPADQQFAHRDGNCLAAVLDARGWSGRVMLIADQALVALGVEMLLGSDASESPFSIARPFTRIETRLARILLEPLARSFERAFAPVIPTALGFEDLSPAIRFDIFGRRSNPAVSAHFRVRLGRHSGELVLAIPQALLTPMRAKLSRAEPEEEPTPDPHWTEKIQQEVTRTSVTLVAILDERGITLADIAGFRVGQLLPLEATPSSRVRVECNGELLMQCQLGKSNGNFTLRVEEFVDKDQEFIDGILSR